MKSYRITVNGNVYDVAVEETGASAPAAAPAAAPVAGTSDSGGDMEIIRGTKSTRGR